MSVSGRLFRELASRIPAGMARFAGRPAAVFFHGVEPATDDARVQTNHHETDVFRAIARAVKAHFDVLPLAALSDVLKNPDRQPRALFLMSDDGYANTLNVAADLLEEYRLPWTLFVSTHHIDTRERNPVFVARLFAFYAPDGVYHLPQLPDPVVLGSGDELRSLAATHLVSALKTLDGPLARQAVQRLIEILTPARAEHLFARFSSEEFLTWDGVRDLAQRGVTIGAHADFHWPMNASQSEGYLAHQAAHPRARIEAEVGPCSAFAYPFGNVNDVTRDAWHAVRDAGYDHAFTTLSGSLESRMSPYLLPRYGLSPREPRPASLIPLLRAGNRRLLEWQRSLAA
ncbi:MAG TPA: polysaccharide deacetylase family protein [Rhizomicrobium sp.]|jgi:peptidoglycan/xylan/chitin deacetylase (PgdA/CDA1 family)